MSTPASAKSKATGSTSTVAANQHAALNASQNKPLIHFNGLFYLPSIPVV